MGRGGCRSDGCGHYVSVGGDQCRQIREGLLLVRREGGERSEKVIDATRRQQVEEGVRRQWERVRSERLRREVLRQQARGEGLSLRDTHHTGTLLLCPLRRKHDQR